MFVGSTIVSNTFISGAGALAETLCPGLLFNFPFLCPNDTAWVTVYDGRFDTRFDFYKN